MKKFQRSIGTELMLLKNRSFIQSLESQGLAEAAALRAAEATRRYTATSGINKVELDLFTALVVLVSFVLTMVGIVGALFLFLPGSPS